MKIWVSVMLSGLFLSHVQAEELYCAKKYVNTERTYQEISLKKVPKGWSITDFSHENLELDQCDMDSLQNDPWHKFLFSCKGSYGSERDLYASSSHIYETTIFETKEYIRIRLYGLQGPVDYEYKLSECVWR